MFMNVYMDTITGTLVNIFSVVLTMSLHASVAAIFIVLIKRIPVFKMNVRVGYLIWLLGKT